MYVGGELPSKARLALHDRLIARRSEIEQTTLARVRAIDDPAAVRDPEYLVGLEGVVSAMIGFAIEAIAKGEVPPVPLSLYPQARRAARNGVGIGTVANRYVTGFVALMEFVAEEASPDHFNLVHRRLARLLNDLIKEIEAVHTLETCRGGQSREARRGRLIDELLAGGPVDPGEAVPDCDFDAWHVGVIATGPNAIDTVRDLAKTSDRRLLQFRRGERSVWAWLTGRRKLESMKLQLLAAERMPSDGCLAFGEPHEGLRGWRLSHHQAAAALAVGLRRNDRIVRYGEVTTEASLLRDPVRAVSLRQRYLVPLEAERDGGKKYLETLRAYFSHDRNMEAAGIALGGVARQTVSSRLRKIEARLGSDLYACAHDLEAALVLARLDRDEHAPASDLEGAGCGLSDGRGGIRSPDLLGGRNTGIRPDRSTVSAHPRTE